MENNQEIWKPIDGFEDYYQVSSLGRIRGLDRVVNRNGAKVSRKGRILKLRKCNGGYLQVGLFKDGKSIKFLVHRLVYEAFNGQIPEGMEINHIDEDKSNNNIKNLNLMTHKENVNWGTAIERRSKPVIQYSLSGKKLAEFDSLSDASRRLSINPGNIYNVLNGRQKTAGGFKWKFKDINSKIQK